MGQATARPVPWGGAPARPNLGQKYESTPKLKRTRAHPIFGGTLLLMPIPFDVERSMRSSNTYEGQARS